MMKTKLSEKQSQVQCIEDESKPREANSQVQHTRAQKYFRDAYFVCLV